MSIAELKNKIRDKLENLSIEQLKEVDNYIEHINNTKVEEYELLSFAEDIIAEREEVLKKLAQ